MNRNSTLLLVLGVIVLTASCAPEAQGQVCPWGMHAQLQMQIQWQQQQQQQMQAMQHMQMQMAQQQMMRQQMMAQNVAMQQQQQAMRLRFMTQMHPVVRQQHVMAQFQHVQHQQLTSRQQAGFFYWYYFRWYGHGGPHFHWSFVHRNMTGGQRTQHLVTTNQFHRVAHLQHITAARHTTVQQTHTPASTPRHVTNLVPHRQQQIIPRHQYQITTHHQAQTITTHRPTVQLRVKMGMTCGNCHQGQPSGPTLALRPPSNPLKPLVNRPNQPDVPRMMNRMPQPGLPRMIAQLPPRQPLLPVAAAPMLIQPLVQLPRVMPIGAVPMRLPVPPFGVAMGVPQAPPPLGPIALLQPPPLPRMIGGPRNGMPLPLLAESAKSPGDSMRREPATPEGTAASADSKSASPSTLEGVVLQLVSAIAKGEPSEKRRGESATTAEILPELVRQTPLLPRLEAKYPVPRLMPGPERPAPTNQATPSLVEVVMRTPPLPTLPEPVAQPAPVE